MRSEQTHLERSYKSFIDRGQTLAFFTGLAGYLDEVFNTPELENHFGDQLRDRNAKYLEIRKLEEQSVLEMRQAKKKLQAILRKRKIKVQMLRRFNTHPFSPDTDIIEEMEAYEKGRAWGGRYLSLTLNDFLFDIAASVLGLGYGSDVAEFVVSPAEYSAYYKRINGPGSVIIAGNEITHFIFSPTLPARCELTNLVERERRMKPWGQYEKLYQFRCMYQRAARNAEIVPIFQSADKYLLPEADAVEMNFMQLELEELVERPLHRRTSVPRVVDHLSLENLKLAVQTVHGHLMRVLDGEEEGGGLFFLLSASGTLTRRSPISGDELYAMDKGSSRHRVLQELARAQTKSDRYYATKEMAAELTMTPEQAMKTVGELRRQICQHFRGVRHNDVIESRRRSGYRINPSARVVES